MGTRMYQECLDFENLLEYQPGSIICLVRDEESGWLIWMLRPRARLGIGHHADGVANQMSCFRSRCADRIRECASLLSARYIILIYSITYTIILMCSMEADCQYAKRENSGICRYLEVGDTRSVWRPVLQRVQVLNGCFTKLTLR